MLKEYTVEVILDQEFNGDHFEQVNTATEGLIGEGISCGDPFIALDCKSLSMADAVQEVVEMLEDLGYSIRKVMIESATETASPDA